MYNHVGVTGPTAFAQLPAEDQLFWNNWFSEQCRRATERNESIKERLGSL